MAAQKRLNKEVNTITNDDNEGQNEKIEKDDYQIDMADPNRIQFKSAIKKRKSQAFGRL